MTAQRSLAREMRSRRAPMRWRSAALIAPAIIFLLVFFAYPVGEMLKLSFTELLATEHGRFGNYEWFFGNDANVRVLRRTVTTAFLVTAVCVVLSYPYAYLMTIVSPWWRNAMLVAVLVPFWTSLMVRNYAWLVLLQDNGPVNDALAWIGIGRVQLVDTIRAVVIGMAQILLPFMVLPLYAVLRGIDRRLLLAAEGLGARPATAFMRVYLPLSLPGVLAGSLVVFVLALGFFLAPALLGSPREALLSQLIVTQVNQLLAWGRGGAMAAVLLLVTLALIATASLVARRAPAAQNEGNV